MNCISRSVLLLTLSAHSLVSQTAPPARPQPAAKPSVGKRPLRWADTLRVARAPLGELLGDLDLAPAFEFNDFRDNLLSQTRSLENDFAWKAQSFGDQLATANQRLQEMRFTLQSEHQLTTTEWNENLLHSPLLAQLPFSLGDAEPQLARYFGEDASFSWSGPQAPARAGDSRSASDPADSLYRLARELLNSGEYRRAVAAFRDVTTKTPNSAYVADALYWQAFALYRMGGTSELRAAIEALDTQKSKYPGARMQAETDALSLRIRGALAARGDAAAAAQIRTVAGDSALRCDREDQSVRVEALNALTQSDPDGAMPVLEKTLARKDICSTMLRRTAVFLIGSRRRDGSAVTLLTKVAKTDPSNEVRGSAMEWLARAPGDAALTALEELAKDNSDEQLQRAAVRALVSHPSPRARQLVRSMVERSETPERIRLEGLASFDKERSTAEDVAWMRNLYTRSDNARIKARIVNTLSNIGGTEVDQWLLTVARNTEEDSETRRYAVRRVGRTLPVGEVAKLYDAAAERSIRESLIGALASRAEAEATDKLLEIVKTGTDPQLRGQAISALSAKKDPRTLRLLMEIIDK